MKTLCFDSIGGASGDMILAALIDLGVERDKITNGLSGLHLDSFDIRSAAFSSNGLNGTQVSVDVHDNDHHHKHSHDHHAEHSHSHGHGHEHTHERGLVEIRALIEKAGLPPRARELAVRTFTRLAEAEGKIHGRAPEQVHFHEVGAVDSIVDIVGCCLALDMLDVGEVAVGALPLGSGTTTCRHGVIPVPVPATVELLKGMPVTYTGEPFELVTPTGAALLSAWKTLDLPPPGSRAIAIGHGFGHRTLTGRPNLLRAVLLESGGKADSSPADCLVLESNIDDCNPELIGSLTEKLIEAGALDVFVSPVFMKKQRPGFLLTVLCEPERKEMLLDLIFTESTTFGVREYPVKRTILDRAITQVETLFGKISVKTGTWRGRAVTRAPEHEDCARLAKEAGVAVRTVYEAALKAALSQDGAT